MRGTSERRIFLYGNGAGRYLFAPAPADLSCAYFIIKTQAVAKSQTKGAAAQSKKRAALLHAARFCFFRAFAVSSRQTAF